MFCPCSAGGGLISGPPGLAGEGKGAGASGAVETTVEPSY